MIRQTTPSSSFRRAIESAERLDLLEGLPHPTFEAHAFSQESASNVVRDILGSLFYRESHSLNAEDHAAIRSVLGDPRTFVPCPGAGAFRRCGGFHADFAIEFRHDAQVGGALICFGCGEIKTLIQSDRWHHDLLPDAEVALSRVLLGYRHKRPIPTPPRAAARRVEISRPDALEAVGTILTELEAYHRTHDRYPSALSRRQGRRGSARGMIYYQALSGGRDFWLAYSDPERDGEIVFRSGSLPTAS